ncbi:MAG: hypothetical protein CMQ40_07860 [Gammaproteobacteria bacterium]|nr:hypothetical protein [Gammaproteobacteria bacterium]
MGRVFILCRTFPFQKFMLQRTLQKKEPRNKMPTHNLSQVGTPVAVVGNSVQTATTIHHPILAANEGVGFWNISAFNTSQNHVTLHIEIGNAHCVMSVSIPPSGQGVQPVLYQFPLSRNVHLKAHASEGNVVYLYGHWKS